MNLLILGAGIMQIPAIKTAKDMGCFVICADGNPEPAGKELCDIFYNIDIKDRGGILKIAEKFNNKHGLDGVFTAGTDFSTTVSWVAEKLKLPGIPYQSALNATDKVRMRNCFKEHSVPSPGHVEFSSDMDLKEKTASLDYPLVVKPVDNMGSRGVRRVDNDQQLSEAVKESIKLSRTSRVVIEEFIEGDEFSLDALVIDGRVTVLGFADREITFPPFFVEMGHTMPTTLSEDKIKEVIEVFTRGIKSLGIEYGCAKGDMKLGKKGAVVGEIAARLSGGYMSGWTYPYASGINITKCGIELAVGRIPSLDFKDNGHFSAERAFISIPGVVKEIIQPSKKSRELKECFINIAPGDSVKFPINNVEKCGNIITLSDKRDKAVKSAEKYAAEILVRLEPGNYYTDQFLFENKRGFAPEAFNFNSEILSDLEDDVEVDGSTIYVKKVDAILKSRKKDWQKRTVNQVMKLVAKYYKIEFVDDCNCGKEFYTSLINGSIQGVLYYLDSLEI